MHARSSRRYCRGAEEEQDDVGIGTLIIRVDSSRDSDISTVVNEHLTQLDQYGCELLRRYWHGADDFSQDTV